jgi:hypothetical protein
MTGGGRRLTSLIAGRAVVADTGVAGSFDQVGVVPGAADDGVGAVPPGRVEVARAGDVGQGQGEQPPGLVAGKGRVSGPVPDDADGAQEFDPVGIEWSRLEDRFELNLDADLPGDQQPAAV